MVSVASGEGAESSSTTLAAVQIGASCDDGLRLVRVSPTEDEDPGNETATKWMGQAVTLLEGQWPRKESPGESYRQKLIHPYPGNVQYYGLPCSYLLIQDDNCVGHGRLTECFESAGGNAAAATFIVIDSGKRGQGLGRQLMKFLEDEAERLGYHYVYLWTKTAIPFYQTIGYQECQRVSLKRACLKVLDASQVEHLEASLFRKIELQQQKGRDHSFPGKKCKGASAETILLQPSCDGEDKDAKDVWLRKRLVEHVASIYVSESQRLEEVTAVVSKHSTSKSVDAILSWGYFLLSLPWQGQIGPSCGLAALRMVREYYFSQVKVSKVGIESDGQAQFPSLLGEAQERGYTQDGEVFNVNNLMDIADSVCGLDCQMWSTRDLQHAQVWNVLRTGGVFVLPYDSNARTRRPAVLAGKGAHYGIIVGVLVGLPAVTPDAPLETLDRHDRHALDRTEVDTLYLIVQHSLSSQLSIAPWNDFLHSNQQLDIVHQTKFGIQDLDLKNRIICCRGMRSDAF